MFYLTPAAISYLTQVILAALSGGYVLHLAKQPRCPLHTRLLGGFLCTLTVFLSTLFAETTLPPAPRLYVVMFQVPILCLAWIFLTLFAYHFPGLLLPRRARLALSLAGLYSLWEWGYLVFRIIRLRGGMVEYRIDRTDWILLLFLFWPAFVTIRQMYVLTPVENRLAARLVAPWRHPPSPQVRTLRAFSIIFIGVAALNLFNILHTFNVISAAIANTGITIGTLIGLFAFVQTYINQSGTTSFIVKFSGITLTTILAILGTVGWVIAPVHSAAYHHDLTAPLALRFTPNADGGYQIAEIPFEFDHNLGQNLGLDDGRQRGCSDPIKMAFPFYGQICQQLYVCNDGVIGLGQPIHYREYQYHYGGNKPLLMPLLLDLDPTISPGGVWARQDTDRLVVTWDRLHAFYQPQVEFTFQTILYADGRFDFLYAELPQQLIFLPNDDPGANPWAIGALPAERDDRRITRLSLTNLPARSGPKGIIYDIYMEFRQHIHRLMAPLALLVLVASVSIIGGFPLLSYISLVRPLQALLNSVRQIEAGQLEERAPVLFNDEIGSLAHSFNAMAATLSSLIHNLEERVAERTAELLARTAALDAANAHLRAEIAAREQAQAMIVAQQRTLATLEERARLGRDLHDSLGQVLGYINVQTQAARALYRQGQNASGDALLGRLIALAQQGHDQVRKLILGLQTDGSESARSLPYLPTALREYVSQCEKIYGQRLTLDISPAWDAGQLPDNAEPNLLYIVQEALNNALHHAQAQQITVRLEQRDNEVVLTVADDGVGFDLNATQDAHFGLQNMRERATQIGGHIEIESAPGQGTRVSLRLPVSRSENIRSEDIRSENIRPGYAHPQRVLLVDDQPIFVEGLCNLLQAQGIQVVGIARDGLEAQEMVRKTHPDIVVMDLEMPRCDGLEATRRILAEFPQMHILILTVSANTDNLFETLRAGAAGYLLKNMDADTFIDTLLNLDRSVPPIAPELATRMRDEFAQPAPSQAVDIELTLQQQQILGLVAQGLTYRQIGQKLYLSEATIKYHMRQILDRLHLRNRQQAIAYARRSGLSS